MRLIYLHQSDEISQPPTLRIEETEWTPRVSPVWFSLLAPSPWTFEQGESPTLQTALEFSEWQNPVSPITAYPVPLVFSSDDVFVAPAPALATDEDFWTCAPAPVASWPAPRVFAVDEETQIVPPCFDEDFWRNPVVPVYAYPAKVFLDDDVVPKLLPMRDEDFWQNAVAPVQATNFLLLPYLPDPEEIPAGNLFIVLQADVVGVGTITPVSGAGSLATEAGAGQIATATGEGGIN